MNKWNIQKVWINFHGNLTPALTCTYADVDRENVTTLQHPNLHPHLNPDQTGPSKFADENLGGFSP